MNRFKLDQSRGILFAGTRGLATKCLDFIIETCGRDKITGVLGAPRSDTPWWHAETTRELWHVADELQLPYFESAEEASTSADFIVSVMWNSLFNPTFLSRHRFGGINLHPAPLPEYRGSFARTHAIINRDTMFGATIHCLAEKADRGDILGQISFPIFPNDTALSLDRRSQQYGYALFCQTWLRLNDGSYETVSQDALIRDGGRRQCFYPLKRVSELMSSQGTERTPDELDRLYRAFYLPPRFMPPRWLIDEVLGNQVRSHMREQLNLTDLH